MDGMTPDTESKTGKIVTLAPHQGTPQMVYTSRHDDVINASTNGKVSNQIHIYAGGGDDVVNMSLDTGSSSNNIQHGYHVFSGGGNDTLNLTDIDDLRGEIVGRFDDFNPYEDEIQIDGETLDFNNLPDGVSVVSYQDQQWLEIRNDDGGRAFYALEGARRTDDGSTDEHTEEDHFLTWDHDIPDVLPEVRFVNPNNFLDLGLNRADLDFREMGITTSALDGEVHTGTSENDKIEGNRADDVISGGAGHDWISGTFGDDTLNGGEGDDYLEGQKGYDVLRGGSGSDLMNGGTDSDTLSGGEGEDTIFGGTEDDVLNGNEGDDVLYGGLGDDLIRADLGSDKLYGEQGDDAFFITGEGHTAHGGAGDDTFDVDGHDIVLSGGAGADGFTISSESTAVISDYQHGSDRIFFGNLFENQEAFLRSVEFIDNDDGTSDVLIKTEGGEISLTDQDVDDGYASELWGMSENGEFPEEEYEEPEDDSSSDDDDGGFGALLGMAGIGALIMMAIRGGGLG